MNRRQFIIGSFMAGVLAAVGIKPKPEELIYFKSGDYMKTAEFKLEGPQTQFYVFNQAHTRDEQDRVVDWITCGASNPCPLPGLVMRPAPSC